jgi:formylglycine-generating enzyme required for sulfatase activity
VIDRRLVAAWGALAVLAAVGTFVAVSRRRVDARCGAGFAAAGSRCCPGGATDEDACLPAAACPPPLETLSDGTCDAPDVRVTIPETTLNVGPSDWEAEGRVVARTLHVKAFEIDAFEATVGRVHPGSADRARAASGLTRAEAMAYCAARGGRLPTDDEWSVAAASPKGHRYPWGETGAVCRRAAWGLASGPCGTNGVGPDTVGAHADGDTPLGLHDLAGNVAEWVAPDASRAGVARGGSWKSTLAAELRTWALLEVDPDVHDPRMGARCAYDLPR